MHLAELKPHEIVSWKNYDRNTQYIPLLALESDVKVPTLPYIKRGGKPPFGDNPFNEV